MKISLNHNWKLYQHDPAEKPSEFLPAGSLPLDVRMPFIEAGIIKNPVVADYCYENAWVEDQAWWFVNEFTLTDIDADGVRIVFESLDYNADVYVNGAHIGSHANVHYPFEAEIIKHVQKGVNTVVVQLTCGHQHIPEEHVEEFKDIVCTEKRDHRGDRGDTRRVFMRKPQYVYGWDWAPRIPSIGIIKNAYVLANRKLSSPSVCLVTKGLTENTAIVSLEVEFESFAPTSTYDADVKVEMKLNGTEVLNLHKEVFVMPGTNTIIFNAEVVNPQLWWPAGAGEQPLYDVTAVVAYKEIKMMGKTIKAGIRTIELNTDKISDKRRLFGLRVNGKDIFLKGANWIPSDSIHARITDEKYEALVSEAAACNFNTLRVWGGGYYENDIFYELCDRYGMLVWQDFMFACALYPDHLPGFMDSVQKEADYQTRRLRRFACLAFWCGNNEIPAIFNREINENMKVGFSGGMNIFNKLLPKTVRANSPEVPYWRSSPFGGSENPNEAEYGNVHHWWACTMNPEMAKRITPEEYDAVVSSMVSEYGYIGPCSERTIKKYYGDNEIKRDDKIWNLHNNTFEKETVAAGVRKHYIEPDELSLAEYLHYARLVQGLMYGYSLEALRYFKYSGGSLFWMYNDAWGEVGWSIVDYYLDRKPSYYYVKRTYAHKKLILRAADGQVNVMAINDTQAPVTMEIEYGYVDFDGKYDTAEKTVTIAPFSRQIAFSFDMPAYDLTKGVVFARTDGAPLAVLRTGDYKDYAARTQAVSIENIERCGDDYKITVKSNGYNHAVHFAPYMHLCDDYFDMLPGEVRTLTALRAANSIKTEEITVSAV
ncbi:MAG: beta-mannosidase [Defluviitaleaceae bacterium]|nr:beta-mannosidase [Defluviitaleaceae bacterium]